MKQELEVVVTSLPNYEIMDAFAEVGRRRCSTCNQVVITGLQLYSTVLLA